MTKLKPGTYRLTVADRADIPGDNDAPLHRAEDGVMKGEFVVR